MNRARMVWFLAVLNVALLIVLLARIIPESRAFAQARRPSDYVMVPGTVQGDPNGLVYVIDTSNGLLNAVRYENARRNIGFLQPIDLTRIFDNRGGGVVPPPRPGVK